jgi:hypothetical protein
MIRHGLKGLSAIGLALLVAGCGKGDDDSHRNGDSGNGSGASGGSGPTGSSGNGGNGGNGGTSGAPTAPAIEMRIAAPTGPDGSGNDLLAFGGGGALRPGLQSLKYAIFSVQICESMQASGSGFSNPQGCLELYSHSAGELGYELDQNWVPLANRARQSDDGFVDLLDPSARDTLASATELTSDHVREYNYGIITWSLPVKVKASFVLNDGSLLYTHDGETIVETVGVDNFKNFYTKPATSLAVAPAEEAVVLLGNGGNWFKFQSPLTITAEDISENRQWVLDLVFNPEGIVKGFAGDGLSLGNLSERNEQNFTIRAVTVPLLDLAPVPHRASEQVLRESYRAPMNVGGQAYDVRVELYSVDGDPENTVYGVDVKTLVTAASAAVPPEFSKVSFIDKESDDSFTFKSFNSSPILTGFHRVTEEGGTTTARVVCAEHTNRAGAEGGAAIVVEHCPSENIDVTFTLVGRTTLAGHIPEPTLNADAGAGDAGPGDAGTPPADAAPPADSGI